MLSTEHRSMALLLKPFCKIYRMHADTILTREEAVSHLFFHCCFVDGTVLTSEVNVVSEKLVAIGLNERLNMKEEVIRYQAIRKEGMDADAYIKMLVSVIQPLNPLALYSYCIELCQSDGTLQAQEEQLLQRLASALVLNESEMLVCKNLMMQRKVMETQHAL